MKQPHATTATRVTVGVFGAIAALAGMEHGVGELLQGSVAPSALVIASWPEAAFFRVVQGEPAMTVVPNLLVTGVLAILGSLAFLVWATLFAHRKGGWLALALLSAGLLLVGGGFGPPLLGFVLSAAASKIGAPLPWWRERLSGGTRGTLARLWPWALAGGVIAWLMVMPGASVLDYFFGVDSAILLAIAIVAAFVLLFLSIVTALARDAQRQIALQPVRARNKRPRRRRR